MRELATLAFSLLGFACFYAAAPPRRSFAPKLPPAAFRVAGALVFCVSLAPLWAQNVSLAFIMWATAASLAASCFVLLTPVAPRVMWALSALSGPLGALLWWGAAHAG